MDDYEMALLEREAQFWVEPRCEGDCWECDGSLPLSDSEVEEVWRKQYAEWVEELRKEEEE